MKILLNLKNERIKIIQMVNLKLWDLLYVLNKDIILAYEVIDQSENGIEYIFQFAPISFFPSFYIHMKVEHTDDKFISTNVSSPIDDVFTKNKKCVKIETMNDHIQLSGTDHNINIEVSFDLVEESRVLEPAVKNIFKKMFQRVKEYIEAM